ncbi:MAG: DNA polymerase III subunit delta, partial [Christensenella sp.]|uniref:DNA polymerase III subunit delta n=1 Tax=Christensenella sp. TaxID=1935934 RepID=UPI002B1FE0DA
MTPNEALKQLKNGQEKSFIVLSGEDYYMKQYVFTAILDALHIDMPELNLSVFEERPDTKAVLCAMETLPFMSKKRITVLKNTDILSTQAAGDLSACYMESRMPASNFFLIWAQGNVDKRKAFVKFVGKQGMLIECNAMQDQEICTFIKNRAKKSGLLISTKNAQIVSEIAGGDLSTIANEVDKLSSICQGEISTSDIEKYAIKSMQYNVYKIHDLMVGGRPQQAAALIAKMLEEDGNPIGFITLLSNNF